MSYLALYRKFRPDTFKKVIGQDHIVRTLTNQIKGSMIGHAYLFCGSRGTGKTSVAKIFARAVNCLDPQDGSPCNRCSVCAALSDPSNIDIVEIDAASNNRVDEVRDIRDKVMYLPSSGKFKVYIIDEVHMLTDSAFNALLKTLEEPPRHVIFVLATTEVHKLPATILSRCMRFDFKLVSPDRITALLQDIFKDIGKAYDIEALTAISRAGEGSVRDALSVADLCVSYSDGKLTYPDVLEVLGAADGGKMLELCRDILAQDSGSVLTSLDGLLSLGKGVPLLCRDLASTIRDLCVVKLSADAKEILGFPADIFESYKQVAGSAPAQRLLRCLEIFSHTESELRFALSARVVLETAVLRAARPESDWLPEALASRVSVLEEQLKAYESGAVRTVSVQGNSTSAAAHNTAAQNTGRPQSAAQQAEFPQFSARENQPVSQRSKPSEAAQSQAEGSYAHSQQAATPKPLDRFTREIVDLQARGSADTLPSPPDYHDDYYADEGFPEEPPPEEAPQAAPHTAAPSPRAKAPLPVSEESSVEVQKVWGKLLRSLRQSGQFLLHPVCRELKAVKENDTLVILTRTKQEYDILNLDGNLKVIKDFLNGEGYPAVEVRQPGAAERKSQAKRDYSELKELMGDDLEIR